MEIIDIFNVRKQISEKKLIGYGAGLAAMATLRTSSVKFSYIVDDSPDLQGQKIMGVPIKPYECLKTEDKGSCFIIVLAYMDKPVRAIQERLYSIGFEYLHNWIDCSFLHYSTMRERLRENFNLQVDPILFTKARAFSLYGSVENQSGTSGTWLFCELLKHIDRQRVYGSIAELGVYKGGNAFISLLILQEEIQKRFYHLFDSFVGFPDFSIHDPLSQADQFSDTSAHYVRSIFSTFQNVKIHAGLFSDTLSDVSAEDFAFVYVDCDLYESTLECCEFFYERLNPGGIMLFHDYDYYEPNFDTSSGVYRPFFTGVKKAVDEFFSGRPANLLVFPETTHALIVKR
jgi:hypothetical protein